MGVWSDFLAWSEEKNLPFSSWSSALEEKGIPGWVLVVLLLALVAGGLYLSTGLPEAKGSIVVTVRSFDGSLLPGASVLASGKTEVSGTTGSDGVATLIVPQGDYSVVLSGPAGSVFDPGSFEAKVEAGKEFPKTVFFSGSAPGVVLTVVVNGAPLADIVLKENGVPLESAFSVPAKDFQVKPNSAYEVVVKAPGFGSKTQVVSVGSTNSRQVVLLEKTDLAAKSNVRVKVFDAGKVDTPLVGARLKVLQEGKEVFSGLSGEDGTFNAIEVSRGSELRVMAEADGFEPDSLDVNASEEDVPLVFSLAKASLGYLVSVKDEDGNPVANPLVRLYSAGGLVSEVTPVDGVAEFNSTGSFATVYKRGFIAGVVKPFAKNNKVVLKKATDLNSGSVEVAVFDSLGLEAQGAVVSLSANGVDLGIPARTTGLDGLQFFSEVPIGDIDVAASLGGRKASVSIQASGNDSVKLFLPSIAVDAVFSIKDSFSGSVLSNARVTVYAGSNDSCTTNAKGVCSVRVLESESAHAVISASGFKPLESSEFAVSPSSKSFSFELVSSFSSLRFVGLFDSFGKKVSFVKPSSFYLARYSMSMPAGATASEAVISLADSTASIVSFDAAGASASLEEANNGAGESIVELTEDSLNPSAVDVQAGARVTWKNLRNASASLGGQIGFSAIVAAGASYSHVFTSAGSFSYSFGTQSGNVNVATPLAGQVSQEGSKTARFSFQTFSGSKEISVKVKTAESAEGGKLVLSQKSSVFGVKTISDPEGGDFLQSASFDYKFTGSCENNSCISFAKQLTAELGKEFLLSFEVLSTENGPFTVTQELPPGMQVIDSGAGERGKSFASALSLPRPGKGFIVLKATRLSKDASVKLTLSKGNNSLVSAVAPLEIVSEGAPKLKVIVRPQSLKALEQNKVVFTVEDGFGGGAVEDARVSLKAGESVVEASPGSKPGVFEAELEPSVLGFAEYTAEAEGFAKTAGRIKIDAPDSLVEPTPLLLALSVDSKTESKTSLSLLNLVSAPVSVSLSVVLDSPAEYTLVKVGPTSLRLKAKESKTVDLIGAIKQTVLQVSANGGVLKEKVTGSVNVRAKSGSASTEKQVKFTVDTLFNRLKLDDLWEVNPTSLEFSLDSSKKPSQSLDVKIKNNADVPLVINQEGNIAGISISPLSLIVAAQSEGAFSVTGKAVDGADCFEEQDANKGTLTFVASFQGVSSRKAASATIDLSSSSCEPKGGLRFYLPTEVALRLPPGLKVKSNPDGSNAIRLPSAQVMLLGPGSSAGGIEAVIPPNTFVELPTQFVSQVQNGWNVRFPFEARLNLPDDADIIPSGDGGFNRIILPNAVITIPSSVPLAKSRVVIIPPNTQITFSSQAVDINALRQLNGNLELRLVADALIELPPNSFVGSRSQQNANYPGASQIITLPNGERLGFSADSSESNNLLTIHRGSPLFVPRAWVQPIAGTNPGVNQAGNGISSGTGVVTGSLDSQSSFQRDAGLQGELSSFALSLPMHYQLNWNPLSPPFKDEKNAWTIRVKDNNGVIQFPFEPGKEKTGVNQNTPVTFLTGSSASEIYDKSAVSQCQISFKPGKDSVLILPQDAVSNEKTHKYSFPSCTSAAVAKLLDSNNKEILETPVLKFVEVKGAASESDKAGIKLSATSTVTFTPCNKDDEGALFSEDQRSMKVSVYSDAQMEVPQALKEPLGLEIPFKRGKVAIKGEVEIAGTTDKVKINDQGKGITQFASNNKHYVNLGAGSRVAFVPECDKGSSFTVSTTDNPLEVSLANEADAKITLSNADIGAEKSIILKVTNNGAEPLSIKDSSKIGSADFQSFFTAKGFKKGDFTQEEKTTLSALGSTENAAEFEFSLKIPQQLLEDKGVGQCIKPEYKGEKGKFTGSLSLRSASKTGTQFEDSGKSIAVEIQLEPGECKPSEVKGAGELLTHSVPQSNEDTNNNPNEYFAFKNPGHTRFLSIINNREKDISYEVTGKGLDYVKCTAYDGKPGDALKLKDSIKTGAALLLQCTSTKPTPSGPATEIKFAFTQGTEKIPDKTVHVVVSESDKNVYTSSPLGKVSIGTTQPLGFCRTNFCTSTQAMAEMKLFTEKFAEVIEEKIKPNEKNANALALLQKASAEGTGAEGGYKKTTIISLVNTRISEEQIGNANEMLQGIAKSKGFGKAVETHVSLTGCGIYAYTISLKKFPEKLTPEKAKEAMVLSAGIKKLASCDATLANAALLTAEDTRVTAGRKEASVLSKLNPFNAYENIVKPVSDAISARDYQKALKARIDISAYSSLEDEKDQKALKNIYTALYSKDFDVKQVQEPSYYDDEAFCKGRGVPNAMKLLAIISPLVIGKSIFFGGVFSLPSVAQGFGSFAAVCSYSMMRSGSCEATNACLQATIIGGLNTLTDIVPGGSLMGNFVKRFITDFTLTAGIDLALQKFFGVNDLPVGVPYSIQRGLKSGESAITGRGLKSDLFVNKGLTVAEKEALYALVKEPEKYEDLYKILGAGIPKGASPSSADALGDAIETQLKADPTLLSRLPSSVAKPTTEELAVVLNSLSDTELRAVISKLPALKADAALATQAELVSVLRRKTGPELDSLIPDFTAATPLTGEAKLVSSLSKLTEGELATLRQSLSSELTLLKVTSQGSAFANVKQVLGGSKAMTLDEAFAGAAKPAILDDVTVALKGVRPNEIGALSIKSKAAAIIKKFTAGKSISEARLLQLIQEPAIRNALPEIKELAQKGVKAAAASGTVSSLVTTEVKAPASRFFDYLNAPDKERFLTGFKRFSATAGLFALSFAMFNIDVRPVRAQFTPQDYSTLVVAHVNPTNAEVPTLKSACMVKEGTDPVKQNSCAVEKQVNDCKGRLCVYLIQSEEIDGLKRTALFTVVNDESDFAQKLLKSMTDPTSSPLEAKEFKEIKSDKTSLEISGGVQAK